MKKEEFDKSISSIDNFRTEFDKQIGDLKNKLEERVKSLIDASNEIYDQLSAIIAREGGDNVSFKDGGRSCDIDVGVGEANDKYIVSYMNTYENSGQKFTTQIGKFPDVTVPDYTDFQSLEGHFKKAKELEGQLILADKVIQAYLSYQIGLNNDRSKLSSLIENDDDEGYW